MWCLLAPASEAVVEVPLSQRTMAVVSVETLLEQPAESHWSIT